MVPTADHVRDARQVVAEVADHTPLLTSTAFSRFRDAEVYLKAENLQRTGSFKIRGAINRVVNIPKAQRHAGVVAASAGNHAQGVALACRQAGVPCTVVMPKGASIAKVEATKNYGSQVVHQGDSFGEAEAEARRLVEDNRLTFIAAFDDPYVIAGQGTIALEVIEDLPDVEAVVVPVGGGGLISGVALVLKELQPRVKVYGVQVEAAPAATTAFHEERIVTMSPTPTIADGIAVGRPGDMTFPLMKKYVDDMVTVSEEEVLMRWFFCSNGPRSWLKELAPLAWPRSSPNASRVRARKSSLFSAVATWTLCSWSAYLTTDSPMPGGIWYYASSCWTVRESYRGCRQPSQKQKLMSSTCHTIEGTSICPWVRSRST